MVNTSTKIDDDRKLHSNERTISSSSSEQLIPKEKQTGKANFNCVNFEMIRKRLKGFLLQSIYTIRYFQININRRVVSLFRNVLQSFW
jgi:hypothetical protein